MKVACEGGIVEFCRSGSTGIQVALSCKIVRCHLMDVHKRLSEVPRPSNDFLSADLPNNVSLWSWCIAGSPQSCSPLQGYSLPALMCHCPGSCGIQQASLQNQTVELWFASTTGVYTSSPPVQHYSSLLRANVVISWHVQILVNLAVSCNSSPSIYIFSL